MRETPPARVRSYLPPLLNEKPIAPSVGILSQTDHILESLHHLESALTDLFLALEPVTERQNDPVEAVGEPEPTNDSPLHCSLRNIIKRIENNTHVVNQTRKRIQL